MASPALIFTLGPLALNPNSKMLSSFFLPVDAALFVNEAQEVEPGTVLAKIPRETTKNKDITGGLPRVAELFEAISNADIAKLDELYAELGRHEEVRMAL